MTGREIYKITYLLIGEHTYTQLVHGILRLFDTLDIARINRTPVIKIEIVS